MSATDSAVPIRTRWRWAYEHARYERRLAREGGYYIRPLVGPELHAVADRCAYSRGGLDILEAKRLNRFGRMVCKRARCEVQNA